MRLPIETLIPAFLCTPLFAQPAFENNDILDANNIRVSLISNGSIGFRSNTNFCFFAPADEMTGIGTGSFLWIAGDDHLGTTRDLAALWGYYDDEAKPGPYSAYFDHLIAFEKDLAYAKYNRIWKVTRDQIEYHKQNFLNPDYEIPEAILNWPGNGDVNLGFAKILAPFTDYNSNELYEPLLGDHPNIKGDVALYAIYNDHTTFEYDDSKPMTDLEVHVMLYAYYGAENSMLYNTVFANYQIINRGNFNYSDLYVGQFSPLDVGNYSDDYAGSDSSLNLCYMYNADNFDDTVYDGYGEKLPAIGLVSLHDALNAFMWRMSEFSPLGEPRNADEIALCFDGKWRDGVQMIESGNGYGSPDEAPVTHFFYHDDPWDLEGWNEVTESNAGFDRDFYAGTGPYNLMSGESMCAEFAFIFAQPESPTYRFEEIELLKIYTAQLNALFPFMSDSICLSYQTDSFPESEINLFDEFVLFPNPASGIVNFYYPNAVELQVELYDATGRLVQVYDLSGNDPSEIQQIVLPSMNTSFYLLRFRIDGHEFSRQIIAR